GEGIRPELERGERHHDLAAAVPDAREHREEDDEVDRRGARHAASLQAVRLVQMSAARKSPGTVIPLREAGKRECGTCTACCDGWVKGTIEGHDMFPGQPCFFRGQGCCTIYERRPADPCRNLVCRW